jgi:hypothetical protein
MSTSTNRNKLIITPTIVSDSVVNSAAQITEPSGALSLITGLDTIGLSTLGQISPGSNAIAIGWYAGYDRQGSNAIAIGGLAGSTLQSSNSIILNASGASVNSQNSGFFVSPISTTTSTSNYLVYDLATKEIKYTTSGGGGGGTSAWIDPNLVNQPPKIVFDGITRDVQNIYIPWTYPSQINVGFLQQNLPLIESFSANVQTPSGNIQVITKNSPISSINDIVNNYYTGVSGAMTGIVLTKNNSQFGLTIPGINTYNGKRYYYYYESGIEAKLSSPSNLIAWYQNYSNLAYNSNVSLNFPSPPFITAGTPSAPLTLTLSSLAPAFPGSTIKAVYTEPQYTDDVNRGEIVAITNYRIYYSNSSVSAVRYPSVPLSSNIGTVTLGNVLEGTIHVYPETEYTVNVAALNILNPVYGENVSRTITSTSSLSNAAPISGDPFDITYVPFKIIKLSGGAEVTGQLTITNSTIPILKVAPINTYDNRGKIGLSGTKLMTLTSNIVTNSTPPNVKTGPQIEYYGFGSIDPITPSAVNNIKLTQNSIDDKYIDNWNQGFYRNTNVTMELESGGFVESPHLYTVHLTQEFFAPLGTPKNISKSFYYDPVTLVPDISSVNDKLELLDATCEQISGIWCAVRNPIKFEIITNSIKNMGTNFYRDPLVNYAVTIGQDTQNFQTTKLTGVSGTFPTIDVSNTINFTTTSYSSSLFASSVDVTPTFNNAKGSALGSPRSNLIIVDFSSNPTLTGSIPNVSSAGFITGRRIYSGPGSGLRLVSPIGNPSYPLGTVPPSYTDSGSSPYVNTLYQNSWDIGSTTPIDATSELQVSNGLFTTPLSGLGYKNYTPYNYYESGTWKKNTLNYESLSTVNGYRFATFAWNIPVDGNQYSRLTFQINGIQTTAPISRSVPVEIDGESLYLYYRFEQVGSPNPTDSSSYSSVWSDGNRFESSTATNKQFSVGNYFGENPSTVPDLIYYGADSSSPPTFSPPIALPLTSITFPVTCINLETRRTQQVYLYCRIGLPMNKNFSFSTVTAKLFA